MRSYLSPWLQSLMTGLSSRPDPPAPSLKLTHVECVEAEYLEHLAYWRTHGQGMPQQKYDNVLRALNVWHSRRLQIAREIDAQEAAKASA